MFQPPDADADADADAGRGLAVDMRDVDRLRRIAQHFDGTWLLQAMTPETTERP